MIKKDWQYKNKLCTLDEKYKYNVDEKLEKLETNIIWLIKDS